MHVPFSILCWCVSYLPQLPLVCSTHAITEFWNGAAGKSFALGGVDLKSKGMLLGIEVENP